MSSPVGVTHTAQREGLIKPPPPARFLSPHCLLGQRTWSEAGSAALPGDFREDTPALRQSPPERLAVGWPVPGC